MVHDSSQLHLMTELDLADSDLCNSRRVGEATLPAVWTPDSTDPAMKDGNNSVKTGVRERLKSLTSGSQTLETLL